MFSLSLIATLALVPFALAQDTSVEIKAIEAHFSQSALIPDLFSSFSPTALLSLNYAGVGDVKPGQLLTKEGKFLSYRVYESVSLEPANVCLTEVGPTPTVTVTPGNSSVSLSGTYTLAMVDADVVGSKLPEGQTRHWLVNGVTITGSTVSNSSAVGITTYAGPWPAPGSGPHRQEYVVALYAQPSTFTAPAAYSQPNIGVAVFDFNAYVKDSGLGPLIAATYINVEEGTATASISPTSAVVTQTLIATTSASKTSTGSANATNTATTTSGAINLSTYLTVLAAIAGFIMTAVSL